MIWLLYPIFLCFIQDIDNTAKSPSDNENQLIHGILDQNIPVRITYTENADQLIGRIKYGKTVGQELQLEGRLENNYFTFYEIQNETVTGVIKGSSHPDSNNWNWSRYNYSLELPLRIIDVTEDNNNVVQSFTSGKNNTHTTAIVIPDAHNFTLTQGSQIELRWMDYECIDQDCYEIRPDGNLDNPLEFRNDENQITILPDQKLNVKNSIKYTNTTIDSYHYVLSYNYPVNDTEFDAWAEKVIAKRITDDKAYIAKQAQGDDEIQRFAYRNYGDFFISLLTDELISGFLVFHTSSQGRRQSIPFTYNRQKHQFISLRELFKKDFDYSFFLKSYIEAAKRKLLYREDPAIKEMIRKETFGHFAFAPEGLLFFTEFNTIYGRRHIQIPYEEVATFIKDKSISSYISRRK